MVNLQTDSVRLIHTDPDMHSVLSISHWYQELSVILELVRLFSSGKGHWVDWQVWEKENIPSTTTVNFTKFHHAHTTLVINGK